MSRIFLPHVITDDSALGGSVIERSFRFNDGSNTHLSRTPSAGNRKIFTISAWVKRANLSGNTQVMFNAYDGSSSRRFQLAFNSTNNLLYNQGGNGSSGIFTSNAVFRDTSAWYHIVFRAKYTNVLASDRFKVYVNGSEISLSFSDDVENADGQWNGNWEHEIGVIGSTTEPFDGYMAEIHSIDGEALLPTDFGFTDGQTGIWMPKRYEGTYGTNGFYLDFSDNSSITNMMIDKSPNGNDWSPDNCNTEDSIPDTPSNNFSNFIGVLPTAQTTLAEGNLKVTVINSHKTVYGTHELRSGKWYWEARAIAGSTTKWTYGVSDIENTTIAQTTDSNMLLGVEPAAGYAYGDAVSIYNTNLYKNGSNVSSSYQTNPSAGDIIGIALDVDTGKVWFARNGTWINGSATASTTLNPASHDTTVTTGKVYTPAFSAENVSWQANFGQDGSFAGGVTAQGNKDGGGQGDFYYAVPSGFKAICAANLPPNVPSIIRPQRHFDTLLYTGNNSTNNITGLEFEPDMIWIKSRGQNYPPYIFDRLRNNFVNNLRTDSDAQEPTDGTALTGAFDGGFSTSGASGINDSGSGTDGFVAWCWKAGGAAVSNTDGSITTSCSANQEAGFSIVSWTGTNGTGTIGHGLGKTPKWVVIRRRDSQSSWVVYHNSIGNTKRITLDTTNDADGDNSAWFNNTSPTSTTVSLGADGGSNGSTDNYIAWCWAEIPGYSKFGKYEGNNNANGTYIHLGFRPAWVMIKNMDANSTEWYILDSARDTDNPVGQYLSASSNAAEATYVFYDFLSDGFKLRNTGSAQNPSSQTIIYMAFAEQPSTTPFDTFPNAR